MYSGLKNLCLLQSKRTVKLKIIPLMTTQVAFSTGGILYLHRPTLFEKVENAELLLTVMPCKVNEPFEKRLPEGSSNVSSLSFNNTHQGDSYLSFCLRK